MRTSTPDLVPSRVVDWHRLARIARARQAEYRAASPFPHVVLDGLLPPELLQRAIVEVPGGSAHWNRYDTVNERKQVCSDIEAFGPAAETIVHALNSAPFLRFLEQLTGIPGLIPDPHLRAAGYMKVPPGGHLGLHYDFATQKELKLERRVNVLLYLNPDWRTEWGGQLELHSSDDLRSPAHEMVTVEPLLNRMVIFNTPNALHGHRRPIACPPGRARLCLSWYFYTAPPTLGWAARERAVSFRGRFDPARAFVAVANALAPPVIFRIARAVRTQIARLRRKDEPGDEGLGTPQAPEPFRVPDDAIEADASSRIAGDDSSALPDVPLVAAPSMAGRNGRWYSHLLEYTNDVIIIWEMGGGGILYWNRAAEQLYGYSRSEAVGQMTHVLLNTRLTGGVGELEAKLARFGVWVGELRHTTREGRELQVEGRLALLSQHNGRWIVLEVNRDITDQKAADAARRGIERQLSIIGAQRKTKGPSAR